MQAQGLPAASGISLKVEHYAEVLDRRPPVGFFEVHTENFFGAGGPPHAYLEEIAAHYPLSFHGVGLSLGSQDPLNAAHLAAVARTIRRYRPAMVSEHLAWSTASGVFHNDLLPVPYTRAALRVVIDNIKRFQDALGRRVLIENPSSYLAFAASEMAEQDFIVEMAEAAGCGLLLDVNNIFVSAANLGFDAADYLDAIPGALIGEIHLAGHAVRQHGAATIRIDDHGAPVAAEVWALYEAAIAKFGARPTLIEWDTNVPRLDTLLAEAAVAEAVLRQAEATRREAAHA